MKKVTLLGAGGKMGCRITEKIYNDEDYQVLYVENSEAGKERLRELFGVEVTPIDETLTDADIIILALPDRVLQSITKDIVPKMKKGAVLFSLDPAAAYAGKLEQRDDISYFVAHPCHPTLLPETLTKDESKDFFGGTAIQDVVCALFQGTEDDYIAGEEFCKTIFAPVNKCYRISVQQMATLEPGLVESIGAPLMQGLKMALDEVVSKGVPYDAAFAFMAGHLRVQFAVIMGLAGFEFSDGAKLALQKAMSVIFKEDWLENILDDEAIRRSVDEISS